MASTKLDKLLKQRMEDTQQSSERQLADDAYEQIFQKHAPIATSRFCDLPIEKLRPFFTADIGFHPYPPSKLKAFSEQLAQDGLFERIIVRPISDGYYEILAGHNRTNAGKLAGWEAIPCEIVDADDSRAITIAIATNLMRRQDLTIMERGRAYKTLLDAKNRCGQRNASVETFGDSRQRYNARQIVAEFFGVTEYEIRKAIKLTQLIPNLAMILEQDPKKLNLACAELIADYDTPSQTACVEMCKIEGYDSTEIRQLDLTDLFGEKEVFLSIFNPLYFIEELGEDGKKLLARYLPPISHEDILAQLNEKTGTNLQNERILSPEAALKKCREEIRDLEQTLVYLDGKKDQAEQQRRSNAELISGLKTKLSALEQELAGLEARRFEGMDLTGLNEQLVDASERYQELANESPETADTSAIDLQLRTLHEKLGQRTAETYLPKYTQHIADCTAKISELERKYRQDAGLYKGFRPGVICPTCRRPVGDADIPMIQQALQQSLSQIAADGKAAKAQLQELNELEQKAEATFRQFQSDDVANFQREITELTAEHTNILIRTEQAAQRRKDEMEQLLAQIRQLSSESECGRLTGAEYERLLACRSEIETCRAELNAAQVMATAKPEDHSAKIKQTEAEIKRKKALVADLALYAGKKAEMTFSQLKMNCVEIALYDVVKTTGEIKDTFKFTYKGRRYDRLSLSEKIRAGMEVSELMKRLTGRNYPVFVDNMESVDDLSNVRPTGQLLMAKCVRNTELSVRPMEQRSMPKAA